MAVFKCKMCGGNIDVTEGQSVALCEYCGTKQTISKTRDEIISNLYNRANDLRFKCEFDRAAQTYEKILEHDNTEAEAHWGIVLCRYGIEYVEDPKTNNRIPTCHRAQYEALTADADYIAALQNADSDQIAIYVQQAKAIEVIQKNILEIVKNENPFDVFICYKETDEDGKRTPDSVIANDIYYQLTQEGFKVFYAPITLEDKLGQEYEPYIFAALNSAKVMLVVGTRPEYFNAVWVRNEWSRFLKLTKTDRQKLLIPCYKDMNAYELPDDFSHLQAQDMGKIGFINDVVRGIKKVAASDVTMFNNDMRYEVKNQSLPNDKMTALLNRGFMELEEGHFKKAKNFFEQVLDYDAKFAMAYVGKLMADLRIKKQENLGQHYTSFENNKNFQKAMRFADEELTQTLQGYLDSSIKRGQSLKWRKILSIVTSSIITIINFLSILLIYAYTFEFVVYGYNGDFYIRGETLYDFFCYPFDDVAVVLLCCVAAGFLFCSFWQIKKTNFTKISLLLQIFFSIALLVLYMYFILYSIYVKFSPTTLGYCAITFLFVSLGLGIIQFFLTKNIKYKEIIKR